MKKMKKKGYSKGGANMKKKGYAMGGANMKKKGYAAGGLKAPGAGQTGLKKLPTAVRNKMGYMYGGGMPKKPRMSNMDYRKGGLVIMIGQAKPMKKGKK